MVRQLQPDILINNRSHLPEDFGTPEGHITPEQGGRAWEACMTFNESWGYTPIDIDYKTPRHVIAMLRQVAAGGGNLLLNIGPAPDGSVPEPCGSYLREVGAWLRQYGPAIYEATDPMEQTWMSTGSFTRKGNTVYYHVLRWPGSELAIGGLVGKVRTSRLMGGPDVTFTQVRDRLVPEQAPNPLTTVIEMQVDGTPRHVLGSVCELLDEDPWADK
jgi:alpha-L-fucosidase